MAIDVNNPYTKFINSTVYLDSEEVVAGRKIALEFKNVLSFSKPPMLNLDSQRIKEAKIYENYTGPDNWSCQYQPIGEGSYSFVGNGSSMSKIILSSNFNYVKNKLDLIYQTKNLTQIGSLIDVFY